MPPWQLLDRTPMPPGTSQHVFRSIFLHAAKLLFLLQFQLWYCRSSMEEVVAETEPTNVTTASTVLKSILKGIEMK